MIVSFPERGNITKGVVKDQIVLSYVEALTPNVTLVGGYIGGYEVFKKVIKVKLKLNQAVI